MSRQRSPFSWGTRVLAAGALLFAAALAGGALLPGTWEATGTRVLPVPPEAVYAYLEGPGGWQRWTPWPEAGVEELGPERGPGAGLRWDHPQMGDGVFEITAAEPGREVRYEVRVEEGSLRTRGRVGLEPVEGGTRVTWTEVGDFGWNPLMGYWALAMEQVQGEELQKGLERLEGLVTGDGDDDEGDDPGTGAAPPR